MEFIFKPIIVLTAAVAMVAGCQRENLPDSPSVPQEGCQSEQEVRTFTVFSESRQPQDSTRTYLGGSLSDASRQVLWNKGDNLYVTDGSSGGKFTVTSESGSTKAVIEGSIAYSEWYSSVYPYSIVSSYGKDGFSVNLPSVQTYYPDGVSPDSYPMVALCDNDMFRFKNVCGIFVLQLKGDGGKVSGISFSGRTSDGKEIPVAGAATLALQSGSDPTLSFADGASTSVTLDCGGASSLPSLSSTPTAFHIVLPYGTYDSITLSITLTDGRTMTVNSSRPLTIHRSGFTLAGAITFKEDISDVPEAVDLGLSVKWAPCNLGASKPEESGGYYQWAGTEDVSSTSINLDWSNCPYHTGSSSSNGWTKYIPSWSGSGSPDNKTVLDPEDDAAHVNWGGSWRMPTDAEWTELINNCTWTWTTQNGVKGYKVTSNKSGYTSRSIFLPASGYRDGTSLYNAGSYGDYWSSSLYKDYPAYALDLNFHSSFVHTYYNCRFYGQSVRPVYGDIVSVTGVSLNKTSLTLEVGDTYTLSATVSPSNAAVKSVTWTSSDTGVATIDQAGVVTAVKAGSATITVTTTDGGYTATCSVTVKSSDIGVPEPEPVNVNSVSIQNVGPEGLTLNRFDTFQVLYQIDPVNADVESVEWTTDNGAVATVNDGLVTAVGIGEGCLITLKITDKKGNQVSTSFVCKVIPNEVKDLSENGTANCYIVNSPGDFKFRAVVRGNSTKSVGAPAGARTVWESYGTSATPYPGALVSNVGYEDGYVTFSVPSNSVDGNALVAVVDNSGGILWSWHIWLCRGYDPEATEQEYFNGAVMMDRNLGATSVAAADARTLGLLYQWGRKDPFPAGGTPGGNVPAGTTAPILYSSAYGTVDESVKHPDTFITNSFGDWQKSDLKDDLWGSVKTEYDPCPAGWRVPDGGESGVFGSLANSTILFKLTWNENLRGLDFSGKFGEAGRIWFPATGLRFYSNGSIDGYGQYSMAWTAKVANKFSAYQLYTAYGNVGVTNTYSRAAGAAVRCLKEGSFTAVPVTGIEINCRECQLKVGESVQLQADVFPSNATNKYLIWYTDSDFVTVDSNGVVKAEAMVSGPVTVIVESVDGRKIDYCIVTVTE